MSWQIFPIEEERKKPKATRQKTIYRVHFLLDKGRSLGFVEQASWSLVASLKSEATFHVHINTNEFYMDHKEGIPVPDLETGMALLKVLISNPTIVDDQLTN